MGSRYGSAYRRAVARQLFLRGARGLEAAVGGGFDHVGALEREAVEAAGLPEAAFLVDVGCGAGRLAAALKGRPRLDYLGLDVAPKLIARAKEVSGRPDWRFEIVDRPAVPVADAAADIVAMFSLITHLPAAETAAYFAEAARVLKPGGALLVSFLDPEIAAHRRMIRPPFVEAIATRLFWAPNVATTREEMLGYARDAGLLVEKIESPSAIGQSLAVLRKGQPPRPTTAEATR